MTSLSMKSHPALLHGIIFIFFFMVTRSEMTTSSDNIIHTTEDEQPTTALHHSETQQITHLHTVKPLVELEVSSSTASHKTPPATGVDLNSVTTATSTGLLLSSRNQTTANEEPPGHSQSGTESLTSESPTTESHLKVTLTEVKSTEVESTLASKTEPKSPSMLQKNGTVLTTLAPTTSGSPPLTTKSTMIDNTTATVVTHQSTLLPNITTRQELTTESPSTKTGMPTTSGKNTTDGPFIQTTATTQLDPSSMTNPTNGPTLVSNTQTTSSVQTTPPFSTTTDYVTSQSTPSTSSFTTAHSDKATTISDTSTTGFSTILIPIIPKKVTTSKPNNTKVTETSLSTTTSEPCSSIGVVKKCLIIIASLAAVATIFIISTIVLCTKLSSRKYRLKKHQTGTEMMCISSLMPERNHHYSRQRNPVPNGVLVIPNFGDSDDEMGDNLTLSSFLPENDRYV